MFVIGCLNDASVVNESDFMKKLNANELDLPPPAPLPKTNLTMLYAFIADGIFALSTHMMKPYTKSIYLTIPQKVFN